MKVTRSGRTGQVVIRKAIDLEISHAIASGAATPVLFLPAPTSKMLKQIEIESERAEMRARRHSENVAVGRISKQGLEAQARRFESIAESNRRHIALLQSKLARVPVPAVLVIHQGEPKLPARLIPASPQWIPSSSEREEP